LCVFQKSEITDSVYCTVPSVSSRLSFPSERKERRIQKADRVTGTQSVSAKNARTKERVPTRIFCLDLAKSEFVSSALNAYQATNILLLGCSTPWFSIKWRNNRKSSNKVESLVNVRFISRNPALFGKRARKKPPIDGKTYAKKQNGYRALSHAALGW